MRSRHVVARLFRSRKILIIDGDQFKVGKGQRDCLLSKFGEIHVFRNPVNSEIQKRQDVDATWCRYHESPSTEKEAVDHYISFFCGQNSREWIKDNVAVTIISNDRSFRNTKAMLEMVGVPCSLMNQLPTFKKFKYQEVEKKGA